MLHRGWTGCLVCKDPISSGYISLALLAVGVFPFLGGFSPWTHLCPGTKDPQGDTFVYPRCCKVLAALSSVCTPGGDSTVTSFCSLRGGQEGQVLVQRPRRKRIWEFWGGPALQGHLPFPGVLVRGLLPQCSGLTPGAD